MKNKNISFMTQAAMIAAIYVVLTSCICAIFIRRGSGSYFRSPDDSSGFHTSSYSRIIYRLPCRQHSRRRNPSGYHLWKYCHTDRCILYWKLREKSPYFAPIPPIVSNIIIVPFVLRYGYGVALPIPFMMCTVGIGEIISCAVLGMVLYFALKKYAKDIICSIN